VPERGEHGDEGLKVRGAPGEDEAVAPTPKAAHTSSTIVRLRASSAIMAW